MDPAVVERVKACVARVVAVAPEAVLPESRLTQDLGYDSLDLVELMFVLEQAFAIRLEQEDMSLSAQLGLPEAELHHNEVLTPRALELLRARYPTAGALLKDGIARKDLVALVSVEGIAATVERKLFAPR
jgi:acyl carrier protein